MSNDWKRPASVPAQTWAEFEGKQIVNGAKRKYWIQDITEDLFEEIIGHMTTGFLQDEPLCRYTKLTDDKVSVAETKKLYELLLPQMLGLVCFTKDENGQRKIAGMNVTVRSAEDEPDLEPKGEKWKVVYGIVNYTTKYNNFFKDFNESHYLSAMGLFVIPEFRGEGIGLELLKAREPLCKAVGLPASCTVFSSIASQKLAQRAGFQEYTEISYDDLAKVNPAWAIPNIQEHTKTCKYMVKLFK